MTNPAGESNDGALRLDFDRRVMLQFRGSVVTSDAGLLAYRELDDVLGLSALASDVLADPRTGRNGRHALAGLFRQSVFGRLAGCHAFAPNLQERCVSMGENSTRPHSEKGVGPARRPSTRRMALQDCATSQNGAA